MMLVTMPFGRFRILIVWLGRGYIDYNARYFPGGRNYPNINRFLEGFITLNNPRYLFAKDFFLSGGA